ncbi:jg3932 [Pararge aegeria aegeria]|uniref:Jg3932 protein n=1 Tax=Pararge aegeria aegeria TaxID=348720 RepID=A0A8S4RX01_9NEOP|nr:jg3932 [Pararge aegeria aegeria]
MSNSERQAAELRNQEYCKNRPRRRSGSSIVVIGAEEEKRPPPDDETDMLSMLPLTSDTGPHREMPVDVPDSFIARNKTPPRYPPPRPPQVRLRTRDDEPLLSSGGSGTSFGSKQSTVLHSTIDISGPSSDGSGSFKNNSTMELLSLPQSSDGSASFGSKKSKTSSETAKCDLISERSESVASVASNTTHNLSDHKIQLLISNGEDSLLDCREGVTYSARTDSVLIREAVYASYKLPPGFDTTPVLLGREVAVDVPESFVQIVKTTPKYPATVDRKSVPMQVNTSACSIVPSVWVMELGLVFGLGIRFMCLLSHTAINGQKSELQSRIHILGTLPVHINAL